MRRSELEHVLRAAGSIAREDEFIVIGSQAILGEHPDAPEDLLVSMEVDLYPRLHPDGSILIDGVLGEGSMFHDSFGYYAHGVGPETAKLPEGWEGRLIPVKSENTRGVTGWCLETHDLAASKLIAGRPRDLDFVGALIRHGLARPGLLGLRIGATAVDPEVLSLAEARLRRLSGGG